MLAANKSQNDEQEIVWTPRAAVTPAMKSLTDT